MKVVAFVMLSCAVWEAKGYPYYPYYGAMDTLSYGASDNRHGGMALSRYYNPYYSPQIGGGMAAFMVKQPEQAQPSQYYLPDRRQQTREPNYPQTPQEPFPPQQENEVYYPVAPQQPAQTPTEPSEVPDVTGKTEIPTTTVKTVQTEIVEPEVEEVEKPRKVSKKKQTKRPVAEEEDENDEVPRMPGGTFFPMFFGYGRNGASPGGATAIANAYSTGRGGVATSHATAYGVPTPDFRNFKNYKSYQQQE